MVRHKNRYLVLEITEDVPARTSIKTHALYTSILDAVERLHGDFGAAAIKSGFSAKYCNEQTGVAVVRARHGPHRLISSSLPFIRTIDKRNVSIRTLYTGATIKHSYGFVVRHQQGKFDEFCRSLKTDEERRALKERMMDLNALTDIK